MDNQQERSFLLGWLTAIIDGEGSIGINARKRAKTYSMKPAVQISNCDNAVINRVIHALTLFAVPHYVSYTKTRGNRRESWNVIVAGLKRTKKLLDVVGPHLTGVKFDKARLVAEFIETRLRDWHAAPFSLRQIEIYNTLAEANTRGRKASLLRDYTPNSRSSKFRFRSTEDRVQTTTE